MWALAPGPDTLSFRIIQEVYRSMSQVFNKLYSTLLRNGYHPRIWRQGIGAILKNRVNETISYRNYTE